MTKAPTNDKHDQLFDLIEALKKDPIQPYPVWDELLQRIDECGVPVAAMDEESDQQILDIIDTIKEFYKGELEFSHPPWDELIQRVEAIADNDGLSKVIMERYGIALRPGFTAKDTGKHTY